MPRLITLPAAGLSSPGRRLLARVRRWSVESQLGARRNAMLASTALAARRAEREDVEAFLRTVEAPAHVAHG